MGKVLEKEMWEALKRMKKGKSSGLSEVTWHGMKVVERAFEKRLKKMVEIREEQYGCVAGKGTIDAILFLRQLQEKYFENDKELYLVFVDLDKV